MQLKLSKIAYVLLINSSIYADDYVSVQYMNYDEDSGRTTINTPSIELNKELGVDYTFNISYTNDTVSGASPIYYDASSGASAKISNSNISQANIHYGNVEYKDTRTAISSSLTTRLKSRDEINIGYSYSKEDDYKSNEVSLGFLHYIDKSKNSSISLGASYQKNDIGIYCFLGNSQCDSISGASKKTKIEKLDVMNFELGYTQILDKTSLLKTSIFSISEDGYLSNSYMRVVRNYIISPKITQENKPNTRKAYGLTFEYDKEFLSRYDSIISYRFYDDDWDITSHTLDMTLYYLANSKLTTGINFRVYTQSEAYFYSSKKDYFTNEKYASSDRRVSQYDSYNITMSIDYKIRKDIKLNIAMGYYEQITYYDSMYYNLGVKYSF